MDPLQHGHRLEPRRGLSREMRAGGFKTVELNVVGWSALAGAGTAVGTAASFATRTPLLGSIALGVLGTWIVTVGLDHRRWRNSTMHTSRGGLTEDAHRLAVDKLRAAGVNASYREVVDEDSGAIYGAIECRQADREAVSAVLNDLEPQPH